MQRAWGPGPEQSVFSNALLWGSLLASRGICTGPIKKSFNLTRSQNESSESALQHGAEGKRVQEVELQPY